MEHSKLIGSGDSVGIFEGHIPEKGFSLVELMVVLVVIGIIAIFAGPSLVDFGPNTRVKAAARDLHNNLQKMKTEAARSNRTVVITFNPVACAAHPSTVVPSPGGTYSMHISQDNDAIFNGTDIALSMNDDDGDPTPDNDYDMLQNTALCQAGGPVAYKFTPEALWRDSADLPLGAATVFQIQNDRERGYQVSVSIAGSISTTKIP